MAGVEIQSFIWKFMQLRNDGRSAELHLSCNEKKISMNLQLDFDEVSPVFYQPPLHDADKLKRRFLKPSRYCRRRKRRKFKHSEEEEVLDIHTSDSHSQDTVEDVQFGSGNTTLLQAPHPIYPQLEFDTSRPDLYMTDAENATDVSFGSLPPFMNFTDCNLDMDITHESGLDLDDVVSNLSTKQATPQTTEDDLEPSKCSREDILTVNDFKRIMDDFILNFSLSSPSLSGDVKLQ